jgi:uncharacterized protein (DUF1499 family)
MMILGQKKIFLGARILWVLALLLIVVVIAGGPGVHLGLWSPLNGFIITLRAGFMGGLALAGLSLIVILIIVMKKKYGMGKAVLTMFIGLVLAMPVIYLRMSGGGGVPPIHDITTDMVNPPEFMALVGKRGAEANSLEYEGEKLAAQQEQAYPDVKPLMLVDDPQAAFAKAIEVAGNMGWHITGVDASALRFEATDYSFWFAFADDIVVIVKADESGSQLDLRSVSRVGMSDLGVNAKRILAFQSNFKSTP